MRKSLWWLLAAALSVFAQDPVLPTIPVNHVSPVVGELSPPESLRPCCAFGFDLTGARHWRANPGLSDW